MMGHLLALSEIVDLLTARAPRLAAELLPRGRREGAEWVEARRKDGGYGDSLRVHLTGPKAGVWSHFAAGRAGDALDLVAYLATGDDKGRAVAWAKTFLGLGAGDLATLGRQRQAAAAARDTARAQAAGAADLKRRKAAGLFLSGQEKLAGTPAARYLAGRGVDLARLGRQPRSLRYHPACFCAETGGRLPALLAAVSAPDGGFQAVHRTWLEVRAGGAVVKAALDNPKKSLGPIKGGCIRLWRGVRPDGPGGRTRRAPALNNAPKGSAAALTEGIEDGLTVACCLPELRVLVAVSLANLGALELPHTLWELTIFADNDPGGQARAALDRAVQRFVGQGRRVRLARPPAQIKDVNELYLKAEAGP
jgi:hypothetical protein